MNSKISSVLSWLRAPFLLVFVVLYTLIVSFLVIFGVIVFRNRKLDDFLAAVVWAKVVLFLSGVRVRLQVSPSLPSGGCLFLFNHTSNVDILVLYGYLPKSFRFGAKIELFRLPLFGRAMKAVGVLPIVRDNRDQVMKVYQDSIARIQNGEAFALAPEGTRQERPILGKFKKGPFLFAINAQAPIVPAVIEGAFEVQPKGKIFLNTGRFFRDVKLTILDPIQTKGLTANDLDTLQTQVRSAMEQALDKTNSN